MASALAAACLSFPLVLEQLGSALVHSGRLPIVISPYHVFGPGVPDTIRRIADVPAYWLVLLVIEFPIALILGGTSLGRMFYAEPRSQETRRIAVVFSIVASISLSGGWLLQSTIGYNNDLGWRAVLPAVLILNAAAGIGAADWRSVRRPFPFLALCVVLMLTAPDSAKLLTGNLVGSAKTRSAIFQDSPDMWAAVRRYASPEDRVANNPLFLAGMTPWPVNISWALLADRRSCFAGSELAIAFAPLGVEQRKAVSDLFIRLFGGDGTEADVAEIAGRFGCRVVLVTAADGVWNRDPFAASTSYRLVETAAGKWRIYVAADRTE